jgi:hypothetical protein
MATKPTPAAKAPKAAAPKKAAAPAATASDTETRNPLQKRREMVGTVVSNKMQKTIVVTCTESTL